MSAPATNVPSTDFLVKPYKTSSSMARVIGLEKPRSEPNDSAEYLISSQASNSQRLSEQLLSRLHDGTIHFGIGNMRIRDLLLQLTVPQEPPLNVWIGHKRHSSRSTMPKPIEAMAFHTCLFAEPPELFPNSVFAPGSAKAGYEDVSSKGDFDGGFCSFSVALDLMLPDVLQQLEGLRPQAIRL
jgi:hypothetical protein